MMMLGRDKKDEEDGNSSNPFQGLEKSSVIQEARSFNETPIVPRKCCRTLTKVMYILNQGEVLGTVEATETFFAMTKLFQSNDVVLRRMVYLVIKEMADIADDVIIVTSSLTKDMTGKEDMYRAAAIRALCKITDSSMLQAIERFMKQAIVDKVPSVSSAALASSLHLFKQNPEVVRRWVNEVQEAASSDNIMVQYHALGLLHHVRKKDPMAVAKMVAKYTKGGIKSPYATCLLIRIAAKLLENDEYRESSPHIDFIESCLRHKSEMVIYEAAHAIVNMKDTSARELAPAVSVLQLFLSSPKPTLRFAATKTLNKVSMTHPAAVTACNLDLENLITDVNRSIATLAITTLLKTGSESSIDRLMKQIGTFMSDISDEFKVVVVDAVSSLCTKFPRKYSVMMNFLASMLRDDGGFEYKKAIVNSLVGIIEENPDAKEAGLSHLCEFIEDCEHTSLATRILHLLGQEGPRTTNPARYIRFIYNRVILENAAIRAAAVSSLAKFGAHCEALLPSVLVLLERSLLDSDDEVRDRATYYLNILKQNEKSFNSAYILNGLTISVVGLERALHNYTLEPTEQPFDMKTVPLETQPMAEQKVKGDLNPLLRAKEKSSQATQEIYAEQLSAIPEFAHIGPLFKSSKPVELTEAETEYMVRCIKHTFTQHIVFQFDCTNTLNDQQLEDVYVQMDSVEGMEVEAIVSVPFLKYNQPGITYTLVQLPEDNTEVSSVFSNTLKYKVKDCDPNTGEPDEEGYEDEYVIEDIELLFADHVQRVMKPNFMASWEEIGDENELEETFALTSKSLEEAIKNVVSFLGMQPCERSDKVPEGKSSHSLFLAGVFRGGVDVVVRARLALQDTVKMQVTVRSSDPVISELITSAVG